jgi:hypothetical protein
MKGWLHTFLCWYLLTTKNQGNFSEGSSASTQMVARVEIVYSILHNEVSVLIFIMIIKPRVINSPETNSKEIMFSK